MLLQRVGAPSFFLLCSIPSCKCNIVFFIFTDGHLGCMQHLAIVNCAAMNIGCIGSFGLVFRDPFLTSGTSGMLAWFQGASHSFGENTLLCCFDTRPILKGTAK